MKWNCKNSTYYDAGKKAYGFGDEMPNDLEENTKRIYLEKGLIIDDVDSQENERLALLEKVKSLGMKVHPKTGVDKLAIMIEDWDALAAIKKEALSLGIDPTDDVTFAELKILVDEKKNESDS